MTKLYKLTIHSITNEKSGRTIKLKKSSAIDLKYTNDLGTITKRFEDYTLSGMKFDPQESVRVELKEEGEDLVAVVKFGDELADGENEIAITLYGIKDGRPADSKMLLLLPVVKPQSAVETVPGNADGVKTKNASSVSGKDSVDSSIAGTVATLGKKIAAGGDKTQDAPKTGSVAVKDTLKSKQNP